MAPKPIKSMEPAQTLGIMSWPDTGWWKYMYICFFNKATSVASFWEIT